MGTLQSCNLDWGVKAHSLCVVSLSSHRSHGGAGHPGGGIRGCAREYTYCPRQIGDGTREQGSRVDHQVGLNVIKSDAAMQSVIKAKQTPWSRRSDHTILTLFTVTKLLADHSEKMRRHDC